jgi:hypothetical protein
MPSAARSNAWSFRKMFADDTIHRAEVRWREGQPEWSAMAQGGQNARSRDCAS